MRTLTGKYIKAGKGVHITASRMASGEEQPVAELEHGHATLSKSIETLKAERQKIQAQGAARDEFFRQLEEVTDSLIEHFAKEEEGLFPFLLELLPDQQARLDEMQQAHDRICGSASRLLVGLRSDDQDPQLLTSLLERFADAYVAHSQSEIVFLREVGQRLSSEDRSRLAALLQKL